MEPQNWWFVQGGPLVTWAHGGKKIPTNGLIIKRVSGVITLLIGVIPSFITIVGAHLVDERFLSQGAFFQVPCELVSKNLPRNRCKDPSCEVVEYMNGFAGSQLQGK